MGQVGLIPVRAADWLPRLDLRPRLGRSPTIAQCRMTNLSDGSTLSPWLDPTSRCGDAVDGECGAEDVDVGYEVGREISVSLARRRTWAMRLSIGGASGPVPRSNFEVAGPTCG